MKISKEILNMLRKQYPAGTRVELIKMNDPYTTLKSGDRGTIQFWDDLGTAHVMWDCGSTLGLIFSVDIFKKISTNI
jgi:hypothetical protein